MVLHLRARLAFVCTLAVSLLLAACGTTVPGAAQNESVEAVESGDYGLGAPQASTGGATTQSPTGTSRIGAQPGSLGVSGAAGGNVAPGGPRVAATNTGESPGEAANGANSGPGRGVTATSIVIGVPETRQAGAAAQSAGGTSEPPDRPVYEAVIDHVNRNGGILGHNVKPIFAPFQFQSAQTADEQYRRMCATWTEDNQVFAVLAGNNAELEECLAKANTPGIGELNTNSTARTFSRFPLYIEPSSMRLDRIADMLPSGLDQQGYFAPWDTRAGDPATAGQAKVGVISYDDPSFQATVENHLIPALTRLGHRPLVRYLTPARSYGEAGALASQASAAVLAFRSDGVDHVIPFDGRIGICAGCLSVFFMQAANNQAYYPRYGMNTQNNLSVLSTNTTLQPPDQLHGALAVGWSPVIDVLPADDPVSRQPATRRLCMEIMARAGLTTNNQSARSTQVNVCDKVFFLKAAVEAGGSPITNANFLAGVEKLGRTYVSPTTLATSLSATRHDGAAHVRPAAYVDACTCYRYTGPATPVK